MWTEVPGFEGRLEAHPTGRIRNAVTHREYSQQWNRRRGYLEIKVRRNGRRLKRRVHRLVALTFIPNPDQLPEVNHKDFDKANCAADNLEWCTHLQNVHHWHARGPKDQLARRGGPIPVVESHPLLGEVRYGSILEASKALGAPVASVWAAVKAERWYRGSKWRH